MLKDLLEPYAKIIKVTLEIYERKRNKSSSVSGKKVKKMYTCDFYSPTQQFRPFHTRTATRLLYSRFLSLVFFYLHVDLAFGASILILRVLEAYDKYLTCRDVWICLHGCIEACYLFL